MHGILSCEFAQNFAKDNGIRCVSFPSYKSIKHALSVSLHIFPVVFARHWCCKGGSCAVDT